MHAEAMASFARDGFVVLGNAVPLPTCDRLVADLTAELNMAQARATTPHGGLRNLLSKIQTVRSVANSPELQTVLRAVMRSESFPVRTIFFDKTPNANWAVAWHQDLHVAVSERIETPGFGPWSMKADVVHVQAPAEILSRMVTVRLHLDDCDETNGALAVIPGSHANGILSDAAMTEWKQRPKVTCNVGRGGLLLMRPLLLHASASAKRPGHRRVLHIEFADESLPNGLRWHEWNSHQ